MFNPFDSSTSTSGSEASFAHEERSQAALQAAGFDRLTRLAAHLLQSPVALVNLVDAAREQCVSAYDPSGSYQAPSESSVDSSLCVHTVTAGTPLVIENAREHALVGDNPAVRAGRVGAYLGVPLITPDGQAVGALCVVDPQPRAWTSQQVEVLQDLAAGVLSEMDLRRTATELRESEARYRSLFRCAGEGLCVVERSGAGDLRYAEVNSRLAEAMGLPLEQLIGSRIVELHDPDQAARISDLYRRAFTAAEGSEMDCSVHRRGEPGLLRLRIRPIVQGDGRVDRVLGIVEDVTELRRKEAYQTRLEAERERERSDRERLALELEVERRRLFRVFEQAPAFIATTRGAEHVFEMANPPYYHLVGHRDLLGRRVRDALPEVVEQGILEVLDRVYRTGEPFTANERPMLLQRAPGGALEERILSFVYQPLEEADGTITGILAHGIDVTEGARAAERIRQAEEHYRRLVTSSPEAIFALDAEGRFTELNSSGATLLARSVADVLGTSVTEVVHPLDLERAAEQFGRLLSRDSASLEIELRVLRSSTETRLIVVNAVSIEDGDAVVGVHGVARDITNERQRDEQMRLLTTVLESLEAGVNILDADLRVVFANRACARLLGCEPDAYRFHEFVLADFLPDEASERQMRDICHSLEETGQWSGRIWRRRYDTGEILPLDAVIGAVGVEGGQTLIFSVMHDATQRGEAERHLRRAERLATVGTLISGVAHELNNPLHAIRGLAEFLLREEDEPERREDLEVVRREADRMAKIVADLRQFAREAEAEPTTRSEVDLNEVVQHVLNSREYSLATRNVQVVSNLASDLPYVSGERSRLEQVVLNLVVNAEQAMAQQGSERRITLRTGASTKGVVLEVADTGPGIAEEHLEYIFDPFWTTKDPGSGSGLGLSLVHSTVSEYGGEVRVQSGAGGGVVFLIELPTAAGARPRGADAAPTEATPGGLRVLVVDDEPANRRLLARGLAQRGHQTDEAEDGEAALRLLAVQDYDVIVSDLRMPGLSGEQLLRQLQTDGRGLDRRLIMLTGDVSDSRTAANLQKAGIPVLLKPIGLNDLAKAIESLAARLSRGG